MNTYSLITQEAQPIVVSLLADLTGANTHGVSFYSCNNYGTKF